MGGEVVHVSYYKETMSASREGNGGDLVVKDEFVRFDVDVAVISRIVGGDGDFEFFGKAAKVFDEVDGEGTLDDDIGGTEWAV